MKTTFILKRGILLFWALWFSVALLSNCCDWLKYFSYLPISWRFASHNYLLVANVVSIYAMPDFLVQILFAGVLIIELLISAFFWLAFFNFKQFKNKWLLQAFTLSTFLWAAFLVSEEIFIAYAFEQSHLLLLISQLICLMAIVLLPNDKG